MALGCVLITWTSLVYFDRGTLPPFVIEKLPVRFESLWLGALRVHVASALVTFPLCLLLMTRWLQRRQRLHRHIGRITGILVLLVLVPSGAVLAFDAKGGAPVAAGFLLSGAIVSVAMVLGIVAARRRSLVAHRRAMHHVTAQMSVAVTSRAMILGMDAAGFAPDVAYSVALWVPVLLSALAVELGSSSTLKSLFRELVYASIERIRHETHPRSILVRARSRIGSDARARR